MFKRWNERFRMRGQRDGSVGREGGLATKINNLRRVGKGEE